MKKLTLLTITIILLLSMLFIPVSAKEAITEVEYFDDGSYCVSEIVVDDSLASRVIYTKSGTKTNTYYSASGNALFSLSVRGTFNYNGTVARATASSYSYGINSSLWSFVSGSSSYTANKATATGTFSSLGNQKTLSVTLACDQDGNLS